MSDELDALLALAVDFNPVTASLSPDTLAVFFYTGTFLQEIRNWYNPENPLDTITPEEWDTIEAMVATALREIMTNMIGIVIDYVGENFPPNILPCDGATYNRVDYPDLYAVIDPVFIIDADTFSVPDLRDRTAIGESGIRSTGDTGGSETVTLTSGQLASHSHGVTDVGHVHTEIIASPTLITIGAGAPAPSAVPLAGVTGVAVTGISIDSAGGDESHENMQPFMTVKKGIIAF